MPDVLSIRRGGGARARARKRSKGALKVLDTYNIQRRVYF
jgi:hypothetical protein